MKYPCTNTPIPGEVKILASKFGKNFVLQDFTQEGEKKLEWAFVQVPEQRNVVVFPVTPDGEHVVVVRHYRYAVNAVVSELPGGGVEPGQTNEEAVRAELSQETGYACESIEPIGGRLYFEPAASNASYIPYLALRCIQVDVPKPGASECIMDVVKVPLREWLAQVSNGTIQDDKTIAVTLLAVLRLSATRFLVSE